MCTCRSLPVRLNMCVVMWVCEYVSVFMCVCVCVSILNKYLYWCDGKSTKIFHPTGWREAFIPCFHITAGHKATHLLCPDGLSGRWTVEMDVADRGCWFSISPHAWATEHLLKCLPKLWHPQCINYTINATIEIYQTAGNEWNCPPWTSCITSRVKWNFDLHWYGNWNLTYCKDDHKHKTCSNHP